MRVGLLNVTKAAITIALCLGLGLPAAAPANDRLKRRAQVSSMLKAAHEQLAAGQHDSALTSLGQVRGIDPNNQDVFYLTAVAYLAQADTAQAVAVLTEGMTRAPLSSRLKLLRVRLHFEAHEYDEADELLGAVFQFKPNNPEASFLSGLASLARGDTSRTLEVWEGALERLQKKGRAK